MGGLEVLHSRRRAGLALRKIALAGLVSLAAWWTLAAPAQAQAPTNTGLPSISGTPEVGQAVTEVPGSWSNAVGAVKVQWEDCTSGDTFACTPIPNAPTTPGSQYTPTSSEAGNWITVAETASDGRGNSVVAVANPVGPVLLPPPSVTISWSFYYTPSYTKVLGLTVHGLVPGMSLAVACHGKGCPPVGRISGIGSARCAQTHAAACSSAGVLDLAPLFHGRHLIVGTRVTVAVSEPGAVGKDYRFTVRGRRGPSIAIVYPPPPS